MSYGPPPNDDELRRLEAIGGPRWWLARMMMRPIGYVLLLGQVVYRRLGRGE